MVLSFIHGPRVSSGAGGHIPACKSVSGGKRLISCDALGHYGVGKGC